MTDAMTRLRAAYRALFPGDGTALREAIGVTIDEDEDKWRRLTGDPNRDLTPMTLSRMREMAVYLLRANPLANRLVELPVAYMLAEGVTLQTEDADTQAWVDAFWNDPINKMDINVVKFARELAVFGEQCWVTFINTMNGHTRLGYLDPGVIETVVKDPDNVMQPIGVVTVMDKKGRKRRYRVIVNGPEEVFSEHTRGIRETFDDGDCFYFDVNSLVTDGRGKSDLLPHMDSLDGYDQALFGELERWNFLRAFIWDVVLKGATPEEVEKRARAIAPPRPGSVRVHNDQEEWSAVTPDLKAADSEALARLFRNHILGGGTIPEHWYGGGGDVNRATAGEMGEPTFKMFSMRQRFLKHMLEEVGYFVVCRRLDPTGPLPDPATFDRALKPKAVFPEMTSRDTTKYATALQQVAVASAQAIDAGLMSEETAVALLATVAGQLGLTVDTKDELAQAKAEREQRRAEDTFPSLDDEEQEEIPAAPTA